MRFGPAPASEWGRARHLLIRSIERFGEHSEEEIEALVRARQAMLWIGEDERGVRVAVVTRVAVEARGATCEIWHIGGVGHRDWMAFLRDIEDAARRNGCGWIREIGRRGWERLLPDYEVVSVVMEKALGQQ